jgi:HK97 family phage portal protein
VDLSALNRTPIGAAARAVGRVTFGAVAGTGGLLSGILWRTSAAWSLLLNRTRFDYRAEVGDPATNSIVGAVVGWIARNFPEAPVRIVREGTTDIAVQPAGTGPGFMLRLLERPNPYYSGVVQWMATIVDFIRGDAYWLKVRTGVGRVTELWWLPSWMVEPRWDPRDNTTFITHYEYLVDGVIYRIRPQDIVHFRNGIHPRNPRKGRDRLEPLLREIFTDDEAANFTASLLRNLGVPGVIIAPANTTSGVMGKTDPEGIKTKFRETFGGDKRGEPMVLTGPSEVKVLSFNPQEMDLKALRRIPEERIAGNLGVPAMVAQLGAGLERSSFTNYSEANVAAYTQGVIPNHRLIAAELEVQLLPEFGDSDGLDVWFDWTQVAAMQFAIAEVWKRLESAATKGLLTRAAFLRGVHLPAGSRDEVFVLPNNYVVVSAGGNAPGAATLGNGNGQRALVGAGPLLLEAELEATDVRCSGCSKMIGRRRGELSGGSLAIKCPRCGVVNEAA